MELIYDFDELVSREIEECIRKWSIHEIKFERLNAPSKKCILIDIDVFKDFTQAHVEFKSA